MRRISRNLTAQTMPECRCEYCRVTTMKILKTLLPIILTGGLWLAVKAVRESKAKDDAPKARTAAGGR